MCLLVYALMHAYLFKLVLASLKVIRRHIALVSSLPQRLRAHASRQIFTVTLCYGYLYVIILT